MSIIKSNSRKTIWSAIDAADATISNAQYVIFDASVTAAEGDIVDLQSDITDLEALNDIIASKAANNTTIVKANGAMPSTTGTIKIVDENGTLVGYTPLYANANLS